MYACTCTIGQVHLLVYYNKIIIIKLKSHLSVCLSVYLSDPHADISAASTLIEIRLVQNEN